jgi:aminodeoxyfutalosine deaminase
MSESSLLVNAHTHLEQSWLAPYCPDVTGESFSNWMTTIRSRAKRAVGDRREIAMREGIEAGIQMLLAAGTTTVGDISASGFSIEPLLESGLGGMIWVELMAVTPAKGTERFARARALLETWRTRERNGMRFGLSLHTPYSLLPDYWQRGLDYAHKEALPLCIHAAESADEYTWFTQGNGPIADQNRRLQVDFPSPRMSPVQYLDESGALDLRPLLVHVVHVDDDDIQRIKHRGCAVVHCPRSNLRLHCGRMPLEQFLAAGVPVYLGTDSLGSSPTLDVRDDVEIAAALHWGRVSPAEIAALARNPLP